MKCWYYALALTVAISITLPVAFAHAGSGTLKGSFKYKDPATGAEQVLNYGFVYLRDGSKPPPMEKFTSKADYILGPTNAAPFTISVPEGTYYLRLLQRRVVGAAIRPYGPPEQGDYTWVQRIPVTIRAGGTLDLGTVYASPYEAVPITVTGTVKSRSGAPVAGRYVRAQTVQCTTDGYNYDVNQCGPDKLLAIQPTGPDGKYTLYLQNPGTYYLYTSPCLTAAYAEYSGNLCGFTPGPGPLTFSRGDVKNVDITF